MFTNACRATFLALIVLTFATCRNDIGCSASRRTDVLLGGGPALCLGEDFAQVEAFREILAADSVGSDRRERVLDGAREYSYDPVGGINLVATTIGASLGTACVRYLDGSMQRTEATVQRVFATGGGTWTKVSHDDRRTRWDSSNGLTTLRFTASSSVCVQVRDH